MKEHLLVVPRVTVLVMILVEAARRIIANHRRRRIKLAQPREMKCEWHWQTVKFFNFKALVFKNFPGVQIPWRRACFAYWVRFTHCACTLMYLNYPLCHCFSSAPLIFFALLHPSFGIEHVKYANWSRHFFQSFISCFSTFYWFILHSFFWYISTTGFYPWFTIFLSSNLIVHFTGHAKSQQQWPITFAYSPSHHH